MARGGFPGMMGGANMQQLARQAQKLQQQMAKAQEELDAREFEATSGGGMVTAKVNGKRELLALTIKPEGRRSRRCGDARGHGDGGRQRGLRTAAGHRRARDGPNTLR